VFVFVFVVFAAVSLGRLLFVFDPLTPLVFVLVLVELVAGAVDVVGVPPLPHPAATIAHRPNKIPFTVDFPILTSGY
jgi:hypothetical protein